MAAGAGVAPARVVALAAEGRHAVSGGGLRAGNGLPALVRAAAERDRGSNDRGRVQKRPHGTTLLPSLAATLAWPDRKSTRLNSSHTVISYAVFCLKKKKEET